MKKMINRRIEEIDRQIESLKDERQRLIQESLVEKMEEISRKAEIQSRKYIGRAYKGAKGAHSFNGRDIVKFEGLYEYLLVQEYLKEKMAFACVMSDDEKVTRVEIPLYIPKAPRMMSDPDETYSGVFLEILYNELPKEKVVGICKETVLMQQELLDSIV